ncbi:MAG TPA: hypothetical protein VF375_06560 [Candidatus Limnocylindrales bacterium]
MRVDRGRLNWGVFFIVLGLVPLAYYRGASGLGEAWRLWPLIIVGIGLTFLLSRTRAFFVGGTVVAICIGLVFGSLLTVRPNISCGGGGTTQNVVQSGSFDGESAVDLNLECGSATITTTTDPQWHVQAGNAGGNASRVTSTAQLLRVDTASSDRWSINRGTNDWQIQLPQSNRLSLTSSTDMADSTFRLASANLSSATFTLNLGSLHVDLTGAKTDSLRVSTNLGATYLTLDAASDLTGNLSTNLGSLRVCLPEGLGVQVTANHNLSSTDFSGAGLVAGGGVWQTPGFDRAAHKAYLTASTSLGSIKFESAGGCQ